MAGGGVCTAAAGVVPESAMEAVRQTMAHLQELKPQLEQMLSLAEPEVLSQMQPLMRAKTMYLLAGATTTLFDLRLRCTGANPDDHRVKSEIERLNVYREKLQKCMDRSKAPLRPTTFLNRQAATRFIGNSLPDLTSAQKQSLRDLSKGELSRMRHNTEPSAKKRKYQSSEKQSVQSAAKEFLEKAARELNGDNENGFKGPLMAAADASDDVEIGSA